MKNVKFLLDNFEYDKKNYNDKSYFYMVTHGLIITKINSLK